MALHEDRLDFISRLSLMKDEAMRLGLVRTSLSFSCMEGSETRGPLWIAGYELGDILQGKQVDLDLRKPK